MKTHTHPKSIGIAHLADFLVDIAKMPAFMANTFKTTWEAAYGPGIMHGIELTLVNGQKINIGYVTQAEQQQDWALVQQAKPFFGVVKSTPKR